MRYILIWTYAHLYHASNKRDAILSGMTLCFQFISTMSAVPQWLSPLTSKPFDLNLRYLGPRIYRSVEMYWAGCILVYLSQMEQLKRHITLIRDCIYLTIDICVWIDLIIITLILLTCEDLISCKSHVMIVLGSFPINSSWMPLVGVNWGRMGQQWAHISGRGGWSTYILYSYSLFVWWNKCYGYLRGYCHIPCEFWIIVQFCNALDVISEYKRCSVIRVYIFL